MNSKRLNEKKKSNARILVFLCILLLLLYLLFRLFSGNHNQSKSTVQNSGTLKDSTLSVIGPDTVFHNTTSGVDTQKVNVDSVVHKHKRTIVIKPQIVPLDTSRIAASSADSAKDSVKTDTTEVQEENGLCDKDTTELWVYPDPSGGLHRGPVTVKFSSNRSCTISWRFKGSENWVIYNKGIISIDSTSTLDFKAIDSCGKEMTSREEYYEIEKSESGKYCPPDMEYVKVGSTEFCIDRYEWPNRKGAIPISFVSIYNAMDSCFSIGKRLCGSEEWTIACTGPYSWRYPYGQSYERFACASNDTAVSVSGSNPECRGFFGVYDMSGNLAEWTNTRARENNQFYYVEGGFWQSGVQSGCYDKRYSYFPQNRHNPVGFRCCKEKEVQSEGNSGQSKKRRSR